VNRISKKEIPMTAISGTSDGRNLRERANPTDPGYCADCGKKVDREEAAVYTRLADTGLEPRVDERGLRDDEELALRATTTSMGSETLDDSASRPMHENPEPETPLNADATVWDGSCYHCGAAPNRVGVPEAWP
jgi:hypothetical protein